MGAVCFVHCYSPSAQNSAQIDLGKGGRKSGRLDLKPRFGICLTQVAGCTAETGWEEARDAHTSAWVAINKAAQARWLQPQKCIFSHFCRREVRDQGAIRVAFRSNLSSWLVDGQLVTVSLCGFPLSCHEREISLVSLLIRTSVLSD